MVGKRDDGQHRGDRDRHRQRQRNGSRAGGDQDNQDLLCGVGGAAEGVRRKDRQTLEFGDALVDELAGRERWPDERALQAGSDHGRRSGNTGTKA